MKAALEMRQSRVGQQVTPGAIQKGERLLVEAEQAQPAVL